MTKSEPQTGKIPGTRPSFASWLATKNDLTTSFVGAQRTPNLINIAGGLPAVETFPVEDLATIADAVVRRHPQDCLGYGPTAGLAELRGAIASRFSSPTLRLTEENVLITASGTQSLDLIGKVLLERERDVVAAQFPTYAGALDAWRPRVPTYRAIDLEVDASKLLQSFSGAKFVYSMPNFSNPTGKLMSLANRRAMVAATHQTGIWLVEDDPYGGLSYASEPPPRLIDLSVESDHGTSDCYKGTVVYLGTMSKSLAPGLRVAWVIASPELIRALIVAKQSTDLCSSGLNQRIALAAIEGGLVEGMRPQTIRLYRERRDAICDAMAEHVSKWFEWEVPTGGMFVWVTARSPLIDTDHLARIGLDTGVLVGPSSVFDPWRMNRRSLRLNFTFNPPDRLAEGVQRLKAAIHAIERAGP